MRSRNCGCSIVSCSFPDFLPCDSDAARERMLDLSPTLILILFMSRVLSVTLGLTL
jgi:hypothetical protein